MATSELHPKRVQPQSIVRSKDKTVKFALDGGCLLVQIGENYPCPIDAQTTHALLNLLYISKDEIIAEAMKVNGIGPIGGNRGKRNG